MSSFEFRTRTRERLSPQFLSGLDCFASERGVEIDVPSSVGASSVAR